MDFSILNAISNFSDRHALFPCGSRIVLGLSGGPDSVFLAHWLAHQQKNRSLFIVAAHLNHQWRPEADQDELFCRHLSHNLDFEYVSGYLSEYKTAIKFNGSQEEVGRKARRFFFEQVMQRYGADRIALAHHADDQQENFFIRLIRGSSITGLTGMKPYHGLYSRPLLATCKSDILTYLDSHSIAYRRDESNNDQSYLRNRIRSMVIPALNGADKRFDAHFSKLLESLQEVDAFLDTLTHTAFDAITFEDPQYGIGLVVDKLFLYNKIIRNRVIICWLIHHKATYTAQASFIAEIIRFLDSPREGTHQLHLGWKLIKRRGHAYIQSTT